MMAAFQIQIEEAIAAPLSFTANGIRASCFANPSEPLHDVTPEGIVEEIALNQAEHIERCRPSNPVQSPREDAGLDVYH